MAHAASPPTLLALARDVFGHAPEAWLITVPVEDLGMGEELSPLAQRGFKRAVLVLADRLLQHLEGSCKDGLPG